MFKRLHLLREKYPHQFWLLFFGSLISTIGASMIWPFLMIYVSGRLTLPLVSVASLMTINAGMGLIAAFIAGPITDRLGRKWVMAFSLAANGLVYLLLSQAHSYLAFAFLMGLSGSVNPLFRIGSDAMLADLIPPAKRIEAYSLMRMSNNIGIALGPALGGLIAATSYTIAFFIAAGGMGIYSLLITTLAHETLLKSPGASAAPVERFGGYGRILKDHAFISFVAAFTLTSISAAIMWVLLGVYVKTNYAVSESQYGMIPMTNALMVVFFQILVTRITKRYRALPVLSLGALFYAFGVGSVALGRGFWAFWVCMIIMTIGELIMTPTATTLVANLAPAEMRGRYMSLYGLTWGVAAGIGPVLGGFLNDQVGPAAIWYGGLVAGLLSSAGFFWLSRRVQRPAPAQVL